MYATRTGWEIGQVKKIRELAVSEEQETEERDTPPSPLRFLLCLFWGEGPLASNRRHPPFFPVSFLLLLRPLLH